MLDRISVLNLLRLVLLLALLFIEVGVLQTVLKIRWGHRLCSPGW